MSKVQINIRNLIHFFDDDLEAGSHSNAIKTLAGEELGLALLIRHFEDIGRKSQLLSEPCTSRGAWLDGWLFCSNPTILYQVEVKSWSMHGYGGKKEKLGVAVSASTLSEYKRRIWNRYWRDENFKDQKLVKVLKPMKVPINFEQYTVEPIACLWSAVHPTGHQTPFFQMELTSNKDFDKVHVFSASAYLRNLLAENIESLLLDLPKVTKRMDYLNSIFQKTA